MAIGTEQCCHSARSGMCTAVSEYQDLEFLCPSCPAGAKTWPTRAALRSHMMSKHGWRNQWRQFVAGSCFPVCQKQFLTRARAFDHLAHRAERCRQAIQQDPDLLQMETDIQAKLDQQDQQERRKAVKEGKSLLTAFLPAVACKPNCLLLSIEMLISVHRSNQFYPSFFVFVLRCLSSCSFLGSCRC